MASPYGRIYLITNHANNKVYVGQTVNAISFRFQQHCRDARKRRAYPLHAAIRKYGAANFSVQEIGVADSQRELDEIEESAITSYRSVERDRGYNIRSGGNGGGRLSAETRKKISAKRKLQKTPNKGNPMPERQRLAMIERFKTQGHPATGRVCSEATKEKIAAAHRGKAGQKPSGETKQKMSKSQAKRWAGMPLELRASPLRGKRRPRHVVEAISKAHRGKTISEEHRAAIRQKLLGRTIPAVVRKKIGDAQRGKPGRTWTDASRDKLAQSCMGRVFTQETREKLRLAAIRQWTTKRVANGQ